MGNINSNINSCNDVEYNYLLKNENYFLKNNIFDLKNEKFKKKQK